MGRCFAAMTIFVGFVSSACQGEDRPPTATPQAVTSLSVGVSAAASAADAGKQASRSGRDGGAITDGGRGDGGDAGRNTGPVLDARRTIASLRPSFRACYNAGLASDSSMVGSVLETVTINANGSVASSAPSQLEGLNADVVGCFARALRAAQFPPPGIDGSTLKLPITFRRGGLTLSDAGDLPPYVDPATGRAPPF